MDEQIYLDPNAPLEPPARRPGNPRQRISFVAALILIIGLVIAVQHNRHSTPPPTAAPPTPRPSAAALVDWPRGRGRCGNELELPLVTSDTLVERTGGSITLTGARPGVADVDVGSVAPIPGLRLAADQYVSRLVRVGRTYYSLVRTCRNRATATAVRSDSSGAPQQVLFRGLYELITDGHGAVWGERHLDRPEAAIGTTLVRLDRTAAAIQIPPDLNPIGVDGVNLVATGDPLSSTPTESPLYTYDLQTRQAQRIGNSFSVSVTGGAMVWNSSPCSDSGPCTLHVLDLATLAETVRDYHLPLESYFGTAVLSADHRKLAYVLPRETSDQTYRSADSHDTPSDLVVLDLESGVVDPIPNLELSPGSTPTELQFSPDGRYLLIGLDGDNGTMLLAWRSGLSKPMLSRYS